MEDKLGKGTPPQSWALVLVGEVLGAAHWMAEKSAGLSWLELLCSHWGSRKPSSRGRAGNGPSATNARAHRHAEGVRAWWQSSRLQVDSGEPQSVAR